ncbi:MAG: metal-dependent hydrolase [Clostridia bacterium]|nr:metal-dependent hydrolase [Clostridia bacterium]
MDNLTHGLVGLTLSAIRKTNDVEYREPLNQRAIFWSTGLGSQFPDLDIVFRFISDVSYLENHRGLTHSLAGLMIIPLIITLLVRYFFPMVKGRIIYFWAWLATGVHIFLDILTSYGTMALWPINSIRYAWDILAIIDPVIIVLLFAAMVIARRIPYNKRKVYATVLALVIGYISTRTLLQHQLVQTVTQNFKPGTSITETSVIPTLMGYNKWHLVVETKDKYYLGTASVWPWSFNLDEELPKSHNQVIAAASQAPAVQVFNQFARYPYAEIRKKDTVFQVTWADLRYKFGKHNPFSAFVNLDENLRVIDYGLGQGKQ